MSRYFDWPASLKRFLRGDTARAEDVNDALDQVSAGLDSLEQDVDRSVKGPVGESLELSFSAALRAGKVLAFDAMGMPIVITAGWRWRGDWLTATQYDPTDMFRDPVSKNIYATVVGHVSSSIATDLLSEKIALSVNLVDVETAKTTAVSAANAASISAGNASGSASAAHTSELNAAQSESNAAAVYLSVDKRYLGAKASAPTVDNQGGALSAGALYFNTGSLEMLSWTGSAWINMVLSPHTHSASQISDSSATGREVLTGTPFQGRAALGKTDAMSLTYTAGRVTKITEDGVDTNIAYNGDGTVNTISYPRGSKTRTETFSYTSGVLTGMSASEA